eukprot:gene16348-22547_t
MFVGHQGFQGTMLMRHQVFHMAVFVLTQVLYITTFVGLQCFHVAVIMRHQVFRMAVFVLTQVLCITTFVGHQVLYMTVFVLTGVLYITMFVGHQVLNMTKDCSMQSSIPTVMRGAQRNVYPLACISATGAVAFMRLWTRFRLVQGLHFSYWSCYLHVAVDQIESSYPSMNPFTTQLFAPNAGLLAYVFRDELPHS